MAQLYIDEKRILPAPFVTINKTMSFSADGRPLDRNFNIILNGTLLPNRGYPTADGWPSSGLGDTPATSSYLNDGQKFDAITRKQEYLREALQHPGFTLQYYSTGTYSSTPIEAICKLNSINFEPDPWVIKSTYTIDLEAYYLNKTGTSGVEDQFALGASGLGLTDVSDNWGIKEYSDGESAYEISRSVSATARAIYTSNDTLSSGLEPWENAKAWVVSRLNSSGITNSYFELPLISGSFYNMVEEETIDKLAGSYSVSQTFLYHNQNYMEDRSVTKTIQKPLLDDNGPTITQISVNGSITGLDENNSSASGKLDNARSQFNTLLTTLGTIVGANGEPTNYSSTEDDNAGVLTYSISYVNNSGSTYTHNFNVALNLDDGGASSLSINGQIDGVTNDGFPTGQFIVAKSAWNTIEPTLRALAFAEASTILGGIASGEFSTYPVGKSVSYNPANASISYNYNFGRTGQDGGGNLYLDEYTVEYSTENPQNLNGAGYISQATINGTIKGLTTSTDLSEKITNAKTGWETVRNNLYTRANNDYDTIGSGNPSLNTIPRNRSVTINETAGTVSYSTTFNSDPTPPNGVAVLDMNVSEGLQGDIFATQIIPGRTAGPILQNIATVSEKTRTIDVALTMHPNAGYHWIYENIATPRGIASGIIGSGLYDLNGWAGRGSDYFVQSDSDNWDWKAGFYTRNITIVYT